MLKSIAVAVVLLLLGSTGAFAASFDCNKASTAFEHVICDQPELSTLDETLATAYATAIGGLSKPAADTMRTGQRQWLDYVQRACSETGDVPKAYSEDDYNCLHSELYNRIRALEASRMIAGWRFYLDESFEVLPTTSTDEMAKPETITYSSPRMDGTDAVAKGFNTYIEAEAGRIAKAARPDSANAEPADPSIDEGTDTAIAITVDSAQPNRISLKVDDYSYGHGAAHGNYTLTYLHYLVGQGRGLKVSDIFTGKGWQTHLATLVTTALKEKLADGMWDDLDASIADWVADPTRWNFTDDGLEVQFQPYEVTAYAAGAPSVTIPWEKLQDDLAASADQFSY